MSYSLDLALRSSAHILRRMHQLGIAMLMASVACNDGPSEPREPPIDPTKPLAQDDFTRTSTTGWGEAKVGGQWSYTTADPSGFQTNGTEGQVIADRSTPQVALLTDVRALSQTGRVAVRIDRAPDNPTRFHMVEVYARRHSNGSGENYYRFSLRAFGTGQIDLRAEKRVSGVSTFLSDPITIGLKWRPDERYWIRWDCLGTSPATVLRMKVWADGSAEPSEWQLVVVSDDASLDLAGALGLRVSPPSEDQVTYPITFAFDELSLFPPTTNSSRPTAQFTAPTGVATSIPAHFDASASTDGGGDTPLVYHWDFGDGSFGSGALATHTYTTAGDYSVRLTVIDSGGAASVPLARNVSVAQGDVSLLVSDSFTRLLSGRWGTADAGGWWIRSSTPGTFYADGQHGLIAADPASVHNIVPTTGYGVDVTGIMSFSLNSAPNEAGRFHVVETYARRNDLVTDGNNYYRYRIRLFGDGTTDLRLLQNADSVQTWLTDNTPISLQWQPGQRYWMRWQAVGTSPATNLAMKVWADGTAEPDSWQLTAVTNAPDLDLPGTTGFRVEVSPWSSPVSTVFSFDDLIYKLVQ